MCGIFGWIKPEEDTNTPLNLTKVLKAGLIKTQSRGTDATGFYSPGTGIVKIAINATEFCKQGHVPDDIKKERFVIGHCRAASSKKSDLDKNAHPFESDKWILVHNGTCWSMREIEGYEYTSDGVDSEIILSHIETKGLKQGLKGVQGSATLVLFNKITNKLYFWTDDNKPLCIGYYKGIIFFASTRKILRETLNVPFDHEIFPQMSYATIYEYELLEYDLKKNKFSRKEDIEPKKSWEVDEDKPFTYSSKVKDSLVDIDTSYSSRYPSITKAQIAALPKPPNHIRVTVPKSPPRGCTSNPPSTNNTLRVIKASEIK